MTIKSKIFNYGAEKEAEWPPRFPEKKNRGVFHVDKVTQEIKPGYPPNENPVYGVAPMAIFDSMPATYHEGACRLVESRSEWERLDRESGTLTFGSVNEPRKYIEKGTKEEERALKRDRRRAAEEALKMVRANPRHINQKLKKEAEKQRKEAKKIADNYGLHKEMKEIL